MLSCVLSSHQLDISAAFVTVNYEPSLILPLFGRIVLSKTHQLKNGVPQGFDFSSLPYHSTHTHWDLFVVSLTTVTSYHCYADDVSQLYLSFQKTEKTTVVANIVMCISDSVWNKAGFNLGNEEYITSFTSKL